MGSVKVTHMYRSALGPTQLPILSFPGGKAAGS